MKVTITQVFETDKRKDGTPLISQKSGKPYFRVGLKTQEQGEQWVNGFANFSVKDWEGQTKELDITKEEFNGKPQWKFNVPRAFKITEEMWDKLNARVADLEPQNTPHLPDTIEYPEDDINPEEIPF